MSRATVQWLRCVLGGFCGGVVLVSGMVVLPSRWRDPYPHTLAVPDAPTAVGHRENESRRTELSLRQEMRLLEVDLALARLRGDVQAVDGTLDRILVLRQQIDRVSNLTAAIGRLDP